MEYIQKKGMSQLPYIEESVRPSCRSLIYSGKE